MGGVSPRRATTSYHQFMSYTVAIITVSDRSAAGEREDLSGPEAAHALDPDQFEVVLQEIVPDERYRIEDILRRCVADDIALVLTSGGTGFAPRDVTPEATLAVIERRADGLTEAMRAASMQKTRFAMVSRAVAGITRRTLIINLPGAPKAVRECLEVILPVLPHALKVMRGTVEDREHKHEI